MQEKLTFSEHRGIYVMTILVMQQRKISAKKSIFSHDFAQNESASYEKNANRQSTDRA